MTDNWIIVNGGKEIKTNASLIAGHFIGGNFAKFGISPIKKSFLIKRKSDGAVMNFVPQKRYG